jgi:wyosine [tRNA(Phe)-imidazoG37] synthetase (radical SAM superfamily)
LDENITNAYSTSKAFYHTDRIKALQEGKMIAPTEIQAHPQAWCNDSCYFCSYRKEDGYNNEMLKLIDGKFSTENKPIGKMSAKSGWPVEFAERIPREMVEAGIMAVEITGSGEPTLWQHYDMFVDNLILHKREIGLVTNGSTLGELRLEKIAQHFTWIRFSMDASNEILHKEIHRTGNLDFTRRIHTIQKLVTLRKKLARIPSKSNEGLTIGISFITNPENYHDVKDSIEFYSKLGVDNIRISFMYDKTGSAGLSSVQVDSLLQKLARWKEEFETDSYKVIYESNRIGLFSQPNTDFDTCYIQRFVWTIGADCKLYPCCIEQYNPDYVIADVKANSLSDIIQDPKAKEFMDKLDVTKCHPCWLRGRNKAIATAIVKPPHVNFV